MLVWSMNTDLIFWICAAADVLAVPYSQAISNVFRLIFGIIRRAGDKNPPRYSNRTRPCRERDSIVILIFHAFAHSLLAFGQFCYSPKNALEHPRALPGTPRLWWRPTCIYMAARCQHWGPLRLVRNPDPGAAALVRGGVGV